MNEKALLKELMKLAMAMCSAITEHINRDRKAAAAEAKAVSPSMKCDRCKEDTYVLYVTADGKFCDYCHIIIKKESEKDEKTD